MWASPVIPPESRQRGSRSSVVGAYLNIGTCATFWRSPLAGTTAVNFSSAKPACKGPVALLPLGVGPAVFLQAMSPGSSGQFCGLMPSFGALSKGPIRICLVSLAWPALSPRRPPTPPHKFSEPPFLTLESSL